VEEAHLGIGGRGKEYVLEMLRIVPGRACGKGLEELLGEHGRRLK
jgi:hypothetical protein